MECTHTTASRLLVSCLVFSLSFLFFFFFPLLQAGFLALLCVALVAARDGVVQCRTRTAQDLAQTSKDRLVWTPFVRKGAQVANTFFNAAEVSNHAGVLPIFF